MGETDVRRWMRYASSFECDRHAIRTFAIYKERAHFEIEKLNRSGRIFALARTNVDRPSACKKTHVLV